MRLWTVTLGIAALAAPMLLAAPSQARTAFQYYAQGRGAYVSSKDHPPGGLQDTFQDYGALPPPPPGSAYYPPADLPPPGYGYGYGPAY